MMTRLEKWLIAGSVALTSACASGGVPPATDPMRTYDPEAVARGEVRDFGAVYRTMGLVSSGPPLSFVGNASAFASPTPDTTLLAVSVSLPNRGLVFSRDGGNFIAVYDVVLDLRQDSSTVRRIAATDTVRVGSLKETTRTDESIIFTQVMRVRPGSYALSYTVRDATGGRESAQIQPVTVPRLEAGSISRPVVVYEAKPRIRTDSVLRYVSAPRSSAMFGSDASVNTYIEAYGTSITTPVSLQLSDAKGVVFWRDTAWLAQRNGLASGIVRVPITNADIGVVMLAAVRAGGTDTLRTPIFVGFGADLPQVSFDEMIDYLRYFTNGSRLATLQEAAPLNRGAAWAAFVKATDPVPETPQNEALQDYFSRIREANVLYQNEAEEGWLSDRGAAYVGLGQPSASYERQGYSNDVFIGQGGRVRLLVWEYQDLQARLVFYDETGGGRWRLTPQGRAYFQTLLNRRLMR